MAVVLAITGTILAGVIALVLPLLEKARFLETKEKMAKVEKTLNAYALASFRIPCPAAANLAAANPPYGFEAGSGAAGDQIPAAVCPITEGIVPFRTLDLEEDMVRDAWGNYFTYAVSPAFAQNTSAGIPATVHAACRTPDWMFQIGFDSTGNRLTANRNPRKARFCCPGTPVAGTDLIILDEDGNRAVEVLNNATPRAPAGFARTPNPDPLYNENWYAAVDTLSDPYDVSSGDFCGVSCASRYDLPQVPPANIRATAPVYVLISHGKNGLGSLIPTTAGRYTMPAAGTPEAENTDGDATYIDRISRVYDENSALSFDDFVVWRTQDVILSSQGESCSTP